MEDKRPNWNRDDVLEIIQDFLSRFPDIDSVWAQDDGTEIRVVAAVKQSGRDGNRMFVIGGAGIKETIKRFMDVDILSPIGVLYSPEILATAMDVTVAKFKSNGPVATFLARHSSRMRTQHRSIS